MRILLVFLLILSSYTNVHAAQKPSKDEIIASALEEYGKVAGSWYLNEKCSFVKDTKRAAFEKNVAAITVALSKGLGGYKLLHPIQKGAKKASEKKEYSSCNKQVKALFEYGFNHSKRWASKLK